MLTIDELYQEIADVLVEIVPERWTKISVNARVHEMNSAVTLAYIPLKGEGVVFGEAIPTAFKAYKALYPQLLEELEVTFSQLWYAVKEQEGEAFTHVTYTIDQDGAIDVKYSEQAIADEAAFVEQWKAQFNT